MAFNDKRRDNLQELWAAQAASSDFAWSSAVWAPSHPEFYTWLIHIRNKSNFIIHQCWLMNVPIIYSYLLRNLPRQHLLKPFVSGVSLGFCFVIYAFHHLLYWPAFLHENSLVSFSPYFLNNQHNQRFHPFPWWCRCTIYQLKESIVQVCCWSQFEGNRLGVRTLLPLKQHVRLLVSVMAY